MPPSTQTPSQQFDFITQGGQTASQGSKGPGLKLPKIAVMAIGGVLLIAIVIVVVSLFSGKSGGKDQAYINALARGQEIIRVSTSVSTLAQDSPTQNLSGTVQTTLTSEQNQITAYLTSQKVQVMPASLGVDKSTATDTTMQAASTNGNLNNVYGSYLKSQLAAYQHDLQLAYSGAGPNGKVILSAAYKSAQVILDSSQVASAN